MPLTARPRPASSRRIRGMAPRFPSSSLKTPGRVSRTRSHTSGVPGTSTAHRQRLEIDGTPFLFQHGYRFGKVTYITRLPLAKNMRRFTPGHLSEPEPEPHVAADTPGWWQ